MNQDREHLKLLSIFHYVLAGFACLVPILSFIYTGLGVMMLSGKLGPHLAGSHPRGAPPPDFAGYLFIAFGAVFFVLGVTGAILNFLAARALARPERRTLCLVVAGLNCLHMPLGTALGVFSFLVLLRPSVVALFAANAAGGGSAGSGPQPGTSFGAPGSPFSNPGP